MKQLTILQPFLVAFFALLPVVAQANAGDISGGAAIGASYAGVVSAPTNGLVVQGNVGIGTSSPVAGATLDVEGVHNATSLTLNQVQMPMPPGGRVTLSSSAAVMTADVTAATTIYYLPYVAQHVPIYNGTNWQEYDIGSSGLSLSMATTTNFPTSKVYDLYATVSGGQPVLCALYWGGNTSRSSTAGGKSGSQNATIAQLNGIWTNNAAISTANCYNNNTSYTISQNQGTLLGSFYTTAAGQTGVQCQPANATGGPTGGGYIDVFNAYNRVPITCEEQDQSTWTYATAVYRQAHTSTKNQINFLDGLQQIPVYGTYTVQVSNSTIGNECALGVDLDSTTNAGKQPGVLIAPTTSVNENWQTVATNSYWYPQLGYHYVAPVEDAVTGTCTFNSFGNSVQAGMILALPWQF